MTEYKPAAGENIDNRVTEDPAHSLKLADPIAESIQLALPYAFALKIFTTLPNHHRI